MVACGALGGHLREIAGRRGWDVQVHCLPAMLHNSPREIAPLAERLAADLQAAGLKVVLAYADCGTYGALDQVCDRLGIARLPGLHCYDVLAGPDQIRAALEAEPGTYLLTDFLVRSFRNSVIVPLGLDRYPELWADYFEHYRRVVWLAQSAEPGLASEAESVAAMFGLPLTVIDVGTTRLERELESLLAGSAPAPTAAAPTAAAAAPAAAAAAPAAAAVAPSPPATAKGSRGRKGFRHMEPESLPFGQAAAGDEAQDEL